MSIEENKEIARRLIDTLNKLVQYGDDDGTVDQICSPEVARDIKERMVPSGVRIFGPSHHIDITDLIAEGDKAWVRLATRGDHVGEWLGVPPTHRKWTNTGVEFLRLENGKIVELQGLFDNLNILRQLGVTLTPPKADS